MTRQSAAIAVFVKTPGLSPIKTRLAAGIGSEQSAEFYRLSLACIAGIITAVAKSTGASPYWAVAEEAGLDDSLWHQFSHVSQGDGGLGDRLHKVFEELLSQHAAVIAIGADSPQLAPSVLKIALQHLCEARNPNTHVLGCSHDGGFYLFGSNSHISHATWTAIPYSTENTAESLAASLRPTGQIKELMRLTDVDKAEDLGILEMELLALSAPTPEQVSLIEWLEQIVFKSACKQG